MSERESDLPPPEEPSPEAAPDAYADATGKGDIHIPGAGTMGMALLIASLTMLFIASMAAFMIIRHQVVSQPPYMWPPPSMPRVPRSLWLSTAVIVIASITIQKAFTAVRRDRESKLVAYLWATFVLGVLFLMLQTMNWIEFYLSIRHKMMQGPYLGGFFILTGLHAAHVVGGLIPLAVVIHRAKHGRYSRNFHPGVRYVTIYWHFLDVVWVAVFSLIYF